MEEYIEPVNLDELLSGVTLGRLNQVFQDVLRRQKEKIDPVRSRYGKIEKEEVTLPEKLQYMESYMQTHKSFSFRNLLEAQSSRTQIVVTFLAMLELMKTGRIRVSQEEAFSDIQITVVQNG